MAEQSNNNFALTAALNALAGVDQLAEMVKLQTKMFEEALQRMDSTPEALADQLRRQFYEKLRNIISSTTSTSNFPEQPEPEHPVLTAVPAAETSAPELVESTTTPQEAQITSSSQTYLPEQTASPGDVPQDDDGGVSTVLSTAAVAAVSSLVIIGAAAASAAAATATESLILQSDDEGDDNEIEDDSFEKEEETGDDDDDEEGEAKNQSTELDGAVSSEEEEEEELENRESDKEEEEETEE